MAEDMRPILDQTGITITYDEIDLALRLYAAEQNKEPDDLTKEEQTLVVAQLVQAKIDKVNTLDG